MKVVCKNCGTPSTYSKKEIEEDTDFIIVRHSCACGRTHNSTFYAKVGGAVYADGKLVDQYFVEE